MGSTKMSSDIFKQNFTSISFEGARPGFLSNVKCHVIFGCTGNFHQISHGAVRDLKSANCVIHYLNGLQEEILNFIYIPCGGVSVQV